MITKDKIKTELFCDVEITEKYIVFDFEIQIWRDGDVIINREVELYKNQFDEIIRVRQLLMEEK